MSDALKIFLAVGLGGCSVTLLHLYSTFLSRAKGDIIRMLLFLLCIGLAIGGGIVGCCAVMGALYDTGQKPSPRDVHIRPWIFIAWIGVVWIYLGFNWRAFQARLKLRK